MGSVCEAIVTDEAPTVPDQEVELFLRVSVLVFVALTGWSPFSDGALQCFSFEEPSSPHEPTDTCISEG
ncbi:hypothetical protein DPMN_004029 [Dreissena polymorpha]|uniref:Uncharacterized protein n=1 Tax=Dreissena polymorpha TaxID=45954 RepID=A0A9D4MPK0_DREPO|nr:hypothetical protein DPMN_004029 [Dreissena polymorpha]